MESLIKRIKPDLVFHLAAQTSISISVKNPRKDLEVNLLGTLNVLKSLTKIKIKKILFSSSAAVYASSTKYPIKENFPKNPFSAYGISKLSAEILVSNWAKDHSIPHSNLRFANVYGERQDSSAEGGVISIFINKLLKGEQITIYQDGEQTRDFIYVEDVISAMEKCLNQKETGTFNVATAKETSINKLLDILEKISLKKGKRVYSKRQYLEVKRSVLSYQKLSRATSFTPRVGLEEGLLKTYNFFQLKYTL